MRTYALYEHTNGATVKRGELKNELTAKKWASKNSNRSIITTDSTAELFHAVNEEAVSKNFNELWAAA